MTEETSSELLTSYSNPNYSHVSSMLTTLEEDEENSLMLMKCKEDEDERGSSALTALADAIHSLEMLTKDQEEQPSCQLERSSSDSAFSSPSSNASPVLKTKMKSDNDEGTIDSTDKNNEYNFSDLVSSTALSSSNNTSFETTLATTNDLVNNNENQTSNEIKNKIDNFEANNKVTDNNIKIKTDSGLSENPNENNEVNKSDKTESTTLSDTNVENKEVLSPGWEKCEDSSGAYYWHVKTGTIQRHPPTSVDASLSMEFKNKLTEPDVVAETKGFSESDNKSKLTPIQNDKTANLNTVSVQDSVKVIEPTPHSRNYKESNIELPLRFAVRSLGWVIVNEEDLTREKSSQTVNKCIVDLSVAGKKDINDSIGKWGDGKYLYMDIDHSYLSLVDPIDLTVLNTQAIRTLRVWGVGRENSRDFAYVARDKVSKAFTCHVFRCDQPARHIASSLCHLCKMAVNKKNNANNNNDEVNLTSSLTRPNKLPDFDNGNVTGEILAKYEDLLKNSSFPTPMDEPKKVIHCHYLGDILVSMPTGIEVLNGAIDTLRKRVPPEKWKYVNVTIAPSTITIVEHETPEVTLAECRVRFLSFLGISLNDTKLCAYIMHTAQDNFLTYVFYCEPSAGPLCKTIEAACKLRFQKCLDRKGLTPSQSDEHQSDQSGSQTIKLDIAEPLNYFKRQDEGHQQEHNYTYQPQYHPLANILLSKETLSKAKEGLGKSMVSIKENFIKASSSIANKTIDVKQKALPLKEGFLSSGTYLKQGVFSGASSLKNNLSSSAGYLKNNIRSFNPKEKLNNTLKFINESASYIASTYHTSPKYTYKYQFKENNDDDYEDDYKVNKEAYLALRNLSENSESGSGNDDKSFGEFIDDDDIINYTHNDDEKNNGEEDCKNFIDNTNDDVKSYDSNKKQEMDLKNDNHPKDDESGGMENHYEYSSKVNNDK